MAIGNVWLQGMCGYREQGALVLNSREREQREWNKSKTEKKIYDERRKYGRKYCEYKKKKSERLSYGSSRRSPRGRYAPEQWINYLTNLILLQKTTHSSLRASWFRSQLPELTTVFAERKKNVPFSMAIQNVKLMHGCSPEHLRMGTARLK